MKKILVIALLFVFANSKAQTGPPCWWTPTWDWLDATNTNWQYYNGASFTDMGTPFQNPNPTSALSRIIDAEDYTPAKGWVLFSKDFGCTGHPVSNQIPFFGLYNRFTGVIRYFFYNAAPSSSLINKALVTLEWQNHQKNTSLLNNTNTYNATNDQFPKTSDESLYPVNIGNYAGGGAWFIAEFTTHFDQTTGVTASGTEDLTKTGQNYKLWFKLYEVSSSSVELAGGFQFSTEVSSFAQSPSPSPVAGSPNYQLLSDAKKFLGKIPSEGDFKKIFDQFDSELNGLNTTPSVKFSIKEAYSQVLSFLNQDEFKTVLTGVAAFAGPAGQIITGAMSVIDFFADKPTQSSSPTGPTYTYMAPTVSKGSIQMEGTITTTGNAKDFTLQLPGVYHKYASGGNTEYSGLPYYDCPLGVLNLEKEPFFQKRSTIKTMGLSQTGYGGYIQSNQAVNGACSTFPLHSLTPNAQPGQNHEYTFSILREDRTSYPFDFYKVDDNVTIAVNDASGLNLEEVQFALVVELAKDASGNIVFDALKDQITYNEPPLGDYVSCFYATNSGVTLINFTSQIKHIQRFLMITLFVTR
jgi:hypothetical protein